MRIPIAYEGRALDNEDDTRFIEPGGLWWDDDRPIPLMVQVAGEFYGSHLLGEVIDVRRENHGVITANVSVPIVGLAPQIEIDQLDGKGGRLRGVMLGTHPVWADLMITNDTKEYAA